MKQLRKVQPKKQPREIKVTKNARKGEPSISDKQCEQIKKILGLKGKKEVFILAIEKEDGIVSIIQGDGGKVLFALNNMINSLTGDITEALIDDLINS